MLEAGEKVIAGIAQEIAGARADLSKITNQLESQLAPMRSQFVGNAGAAFQNLMTAWNEKQRKITAALDEFESSLHATDKANQSQDEDQRVAMSSLQAKLG